MGLRLCFRLLDLGEPSERFFFCLGVESTGDCVPELTGPSSETSDGSTSLGDVLVNSSDFFWLERSFVPCRWGLLTGGSEQA